MRLPRGCAAPSSAAGALVARVHPESDHPYRSPFERDRARIIHARSFRRLAGKTQVFTNRFSDHFRSRLTHTMEVAQVARTIASALGLNQDLTEALALVHDIGHPPFGHAGERALDQAMQADGLRFDHNLHALRIVEHFEQRYASFRGLNLTLAVREGIIKHSHDYTAAEHPELAEYFLDQRAPLEAQIIDVADEIAYLTADLDDGLESGFLSLDHVRAHVTLYSRFEAPMQAAHPGAAEKLVFNEALKRMLNALVGDLIAEITRKVSAHGLDSLEKIRAWPERLAGFSPELEAERCQAKRYLYQHLYNTEELNADHATAERVVQELYTRWTRDPSLLPPSYTAEIAEFGASRVVADYIAGMTDQFILAQYAGVTNQA
jgi:dGTPase